MMHTQKEHAQQTPSKSHNQVIPEILPPQHTYPTPKKVIGYLNETFKAAQRRSPLHISNIPQTSHHASIPYKHAISIYVVRPFQILHTLLSKASLINFISKTLSQRFNSFFKKLTWVSQHFRGALVSYKIKEFYFIQSVDYNFVLRNENRAMIFQVQMTNLNLHGLLIESERKNKVTDSGDEVSYMQLPSDFHALF